MWFEYRQNNSGGGFDFDEEAGISVSVIVEADDYEDANERAERIGLYFNGCETGQDCDCCGDRWSAQWSSDKGEEVPSKYGTPLIEVEDKFGSWMGDQVDTFVHLKDGRKFGFHLVDGRYVYRGDDLPLVLDAPGAKAIES